MLVVKLSICVNITLNKMRLVLFAFIVNVGSLSCVIHILGETFCDIDYVPFPDNVCKPFDECYKDAYRYLLNNLPSWDESNKNTLGFHEDEPMYVDGLDVGVATVGINSSLETKQGYFWAANVSEEIYYEFVSPYAHVNEARNDWRSYLSDVVDTILYDHIDIDDTTLDMETIVNVINTHLWQESYLGNNVEFKSSQTPLIYDPMSTIVYGYASCTGRYIAKKCPSSSSLIFVRSINPVC